MRAISSMATRRVLTELAAAAASAGHPLLEIESVGGVDAARRVAAGEAFDLVFLAADALARLAADGQVVASSVTPLLRSQTAVAVPSGAADLAISPMPSAMASPTPVASHGVAFADVGQLHAALRAAGRIGYSTGPSGTALVQLIDDGGLTAELGERLVQARPGVPVARALAEGEVDLGFQQLSELVGQPGVRILGVLPADCAIDTVFAGAVAVMADDPVAADRLLAFFASEQAAPIIAAHSFQQA